MNESAPAPQPQEVTAEYIDRTIGTENPWADLRDAQERVAAEERRLKGDAARWTSRVKIYAAGQDVIDQMQASPDYVPTAEEVTALNNYDHQQDLDAKAHQEAITEDDIAYYRHLQEQQAEKSKSEAAPAETEEAMAEDKVSAPVDALTPETPELSPEPAAAEAAEAPVAEDLAGEVLPPADEPGEEEAPHEEVVEEEHPAEGEFEEDPESRVQELKASLKDGVEKAQNDGKLDEYTASEEVQKAMEEVRRLLRDNSRSDKQYNKKMRIFTEEVLGQRPEKVRFERSRKIGRKMVDLGRKAVVQGRAAHNGIDDEHGAALEPVEPMESVAKGETAKTELQAIVKLDGNGDVSDVELSEVPAKPSVTTMEAQVEKAAADKGFVVGQHIALKVEDGTTATGEVYDRSVEGGVTRYLVGQPGLKVGDQAVLASIDEDTLLAWQNGEEADAEDEEAQA